MKKYNHFIIESISATNQETLEILIELEKTNKSLFLKIIKKNNKIIHYLLNTNQTEYLYIFEPYTTFDQQLLFKCHNKECFKYILNKINKINNSNGNIISSMLLKKIYDENIIQELIKKGEKIPKDLLYKINYDIDIFLFFKSLGYILTKYEINSILQIYQYSKKQIKMIRYLIDHNLLNTYNNKIYLSFNKLKYNQIIDYIKTIPELIKINVSNLNMNSQYTNNENMKIADLILDKTNDINFYDNLKKIKPWSYNVNHLDFNKILKLIKKYEKKYNKLKKTNKFNL